MFLKKIKCSDVQGLDTRQRILETAMNLFALKGYDGTSIREIARIAEANVAAINYHFQSKENLRQVIQDHIFDDFERKLSSLSGAGSSAEFSVKLFELLTAEQAMTLNQFKLILEADTSYVDKNPYPVGYEQYARYLSKELKPSVPDSERLWFVNVVFSYLIHTAVMSSTKIGSKTIEKFFPRKKASLPHYITHLIEALISDLNQRY